ncbi:MAG: geranylgeranyl reductase family protein [Promethearchaeota archaeon]
MDAEIVVIGAGPAGSLAARQLARKGRSVMLLEEHDQIGKPVHCAGLIGIEGLRNNGIIPRSDVIIQRVHQSIFHAPSGTYLALAKKEPHAFVLHRDRLDQQIAHEAEIAGATIQLGTRVTRIFQEQGEMRLRVTQNGQKTELRTRFVVNAEGINAQLMKPLNLPRPKPDYMLPALQYEVTNVSLPTDTVHLFFDNQLAKNFFAWVIPLDEHHARVGLAAAHKQTRRALDKFLNYCYLTVNAKIMKRYGGIVYAGGPSSKTIAHRFVNIGDAAGQTKATTGGGVVAGGACAIMAATSIDRALKNKTYNHGELCRYERTWKRSWGRQLYLMALLRRLVNTLSNQELDRLFSNLHTSKARQLIESEGDIDRQGRVIRAAITSPVLLRSVLRLLCGKIRFLPQLLRG